jgi:glycosyltransferase involved in cell wall biosynthesis
MPSTPPQDTVFAENLKVNALRAFGYTKPNLSIFLEQQLLDAEKNRIKIAFLTSGNPEDRRSWSGIDYYMAKALQEHCGDVVYLGDITPVRSLLWGKLANKLSETLLRKRYAYLNSNLLARGYAKNAMEKLALQHIDLIFVPSDSTLAAFLETDIPIVYLSGTTFRLMREYYPQFTRLLGKSAREGEFIEQRCISKSRALIYSSKWAAYSAIRDYHASKNKVYVLPYGANLDPADIPSRDEVLARKLKSPCRLLFLGVDWERKGGKIAFDALVELNKMGIEASLTVCGCTPPHSFTHERLRVIPYLNKNKPNERRQLMHLFLTSDFLLLPTRSECLGIVFCEASAFGLPIITTNTGGVEGAVKDGVNGFMLPLSSEGRHYAEVIGDILADVNKYSELVESSREAFEEHLNWDAWGRKAAGIFYANGFIKDA